MNTRQQKFVTEYLKWGIPALAYANAYNKPDPNGRAIESAANRLLRNPEVKQAIHDAEDRIRWEVEKEIANREALDVFTIEQKRHLLKQIATGELLVEQRYKTGDCRHCTQFVRPTINQMLRAIDLDNRMSAHYPPQQKTSIRQQNTTKSCPPQAGVSRSDGGGALAPEILPLNLAERSHEPMRVTQERDPHGEIPPYKEVPCEHRAEDVHSRSAHNIHFKQQNTTNETITSPPGRGVCEPDAKEGWVDSRSTENTTNDNKTQQPTATITHAELMELLYPKEEKLQPQIIQRE